MNTQTHAIVGLLVLARRAKPISQLAVVLGSVIPDAPMFVFYFVEKFIRQTPESVIWLQAYYRHSWQNFIDTFNSLPLIVGLLLFAWYRRAHFWLLFFAAMTIHVLLDFPVHHNDAHRHLFPFSEWRFESPVSYWDPTHYGGVVGVLELIVALVCSVVILRSTSNRISQWLVGVLLTSYLFFYAFVQLMWA